MILYDVLMTIAVFAGIGVFVAIFALVLKITD